MMDYFTIIRRLGLFQENSTPKLTLPPIITVSKSAKVSPTSKLASPISYTSEIIACKKPPSQPKLHKLEIAQPTEEAKKDLAQLLKLPKAEPLAKKPDQKSLTLKKPSPVSIIPKKTFSKGIKEEKSRLTGWSRASSFMNSKT